ncbi:coiled-coil domain-containing protein 126 isoform 1-T1 [Trichechus inunguis]
MGLERNGGDHLRSRQLQESNGSESRAEETHSIQCQDYEDPLIHEGLFSQSDELRVGDNLAEDERYTILEEEFFSFQKSWLFGDLSLVATFQSSLFTSSEMFLTISRKNMSQKLSFLLLVFGLIWGLMLLHYTFQQPRHQSSVKLREQILDLSKRYVKALAEENKNTVDVENGASMAGYADLKRTIAVLLDDILQRLVKLENKVNYIVVNGSAANTTNGTSGNLVPVTTNKRINASGTIR